MIDNELSILECRWTFADKGALDLRDSVRKREAKFRFQKLFDVWASNIRGLLDLRDADDLVTAFSTFNPDRTDFNLRECSGNERGGEQPYQDRAA
jgi:hypothetical protein